MTLLHRWILRATLAVLLGAGSTPLPAASAVPKKIVLIAGRPSHGPGEHEHRAGCLLLAKCLQNVPGITVEVHTNGWVSDEKVLAGAAAIVVYSDGGGGHPLLQKDHLEKIGGLMKKGVGLGAIHYGVEPTTERGNKEFQEWIGGCFETYWSVNPHWDADFKVLPQHAVTRGVQPFKTNDEWYYHMRFPAGLPRTIPILTALPPDSTRGQEGALSTHGGNPEVQKHKGEPEHVMWVTERVDGGRGFGITGGHYHRGWGNDEQRKLVLNSILWIAKAKIPAHGVESKITDDDLKANLDPKGK